MPTRVRSQLALQLPPELIQSIKAAAASRGQTVTTMVRGWLEAGLSGALVAPTTTGAEAALQARVEALEAAVAQLQAPRPTTAAKAPRPRPEPAPPEPAADPPMGPEQTPRTGDAPASEITTAELAERIGMKRGSLNERLRRMGGARVGLELDGWRCIGQAPASGGGPLRWLWEPA